MFLVDPGGLCWGIPGVPTSLPSVAKELLRDNLYEFSKYNRQVELGGGRGVETSTKSGPRRKGLMAG